MRLMRERRFLASSRLWSWLSRSSHAGRAGDFRPKKRIFMGWFGIIALSIVACGAARPIHPLRLEGFPGAPIEGDLFPLRHGERWVFRDRLAPKRPVVLELRRAEDVWTLTGADGGAATVRLRAGWLELEFESGVVRPLKLTGRVGDTWAPPAGGAACTVFGYDRVRVLGREVRALVVAVDQLRERNLYWYASGMGWVRIRTETDGKVTRDAFLEEYAPGSVN